MNFLLVLKEHEANAIIHSLASKAEITSNCPFKKMLNQLTNGGAGETFNVELGDEDANEIINFFDAQADITGGDAFSSVKTQMRAQSC